MPETIRVSVIYAGPPRQITREIEIGADATVDDAIAASGILHELPPDFSPAGVGIFGSTTNGHAHLREGDRIELYRRLRIDPKEARRRRAKGS
jgi:putative ubiquitin-RnfH superfamily antitoxin RatB of RatAB toxin-antitoxin module